MACCLLVGFWLQHGPCCPGLKILPPQFDFPDPMAFTFSVIKIQTSFFFLLVSLSELKLPTIVPLWQRTPSSSALVSAAVKLQLLESMVLLLYYSEHCSSIGLGFNCLNY